MKKLVIEKFIIALRKLFPALDCVYRVKRSRSFEMTEPFIEFMKRDDYDIIYQNLSNGLDDYSLKELDNLHERIDFFYNKKYKNDKKSVVFVIGKLLRRYIYIYNPFTDDEKMLLKYQNRALKNIKKISNECYKMGNYLLPLNRFMREVFFNEDWIKKLSNIDNIQNKCIIDAGAYIGDTALFLSKMTKKQVHSFEPVSHVYELLEKTLKMNNITNVIPVKSALGDKTEQLMIRHLGDMFASSRVSQSQICNNKLIKSVEEVNVTTLDEYVTSTNIEVGLIKTDVEGYEKRLLEGAMETLKQQKPVLYISIYHSPEDLYFIKPMIEKLNLGYSFKIHKPVSYYHFSETFLIAEAI